MFFSEKSSVFRESWWPVVESLLSSDDIRSSDGPDLSDFTDPFILVKSLACKMSLCGGDLWLTDSFSSDSLFKTVFSLKSVCDCLDTISMPTGCVGRILGVSTTLVRELL